MTDKERRLSWYVREGMKIATVGAGAIAAWWLAKKQKKGGFFWYIFGR